MRIWLAGSDDRQRGELATALRDDGYDVFEARDGSELLDRMDSLIDANRTCLPTALVADARLPGHSCRTAIDAVRDAECPVPVVLIASSGDESAVSEATCFGADAVLDRPFDHDALRAALQRVSTHRGD